MHCHPHCIKCLWFRHPCVLLWWVGGWLCSDRHISISSNLHSVDDCLEINFAFYYILKSGRMRRCGDGYKIVGCMQKLKTGNSVLLPIWFVFIGNVWSELEIAIFNGNPNMYQASARQLNLNLDPFIVGVSIEFNRPAWYYYATHIPRHMCGSSRDHTNSMSCRCVYIRT